MDLAAELTCYGPDASPKQISLLEAQAYCRRLATTHYENFTVASRLFPRHLYQHLCNVYAYCRWADDLADEAPPSTSPLVLLEWWEQQLDSAYAGTASHPVFVALRETIVEFNVPRQPFADLLIAFRRDQEQKRYETLADLLTYCEKSANPVGRIVLHLGRCGSAENQRLSDSICTGLQLANFWQDIKRDHDRGRIYLPQEYWALGGWGESQFADGRFDAGFRCMLEPLVADAEDRLRAGRPLPRSVHSDLRLPVRAFLGGGLAILAAIRQRRYDVWSRRPRLSRFTKLRLLAAACFGQVLGG